MDKLRSFSHWLGDFCLRLILLVGMSIVFSAGVYMSWEHTTAVAIRLGNPPSHAVAYTWFVETLLVASEIVVLFQASRRRRPHKSVFVGVAFGATINLISNVSSFWGASLIPQNIGGVLMGATIPVGTAISIWIFATTLTKSDRQTATQRTDNLDKRNSDKIDRQTTRQTDRLDRRMIDKLKTMGIVGQTITSDKTTTTTMTDVADKTVDKLDIDTSPTSGQTNQSDRQARQIDTDNGQTTTTRQTTSDRQTNDTTTDDQTQTADSDKTATAKLIDTTTRQLDRQTIDTTKQTNNMGETTDRHQDSTEDNTATSGKVDKTKRQAKLSLIKGKNDKDKIVRQKAIDYYNQTGKFPSYRQLGEMAGVSKDKAGKIIRQLKKKIS